VLERGGRVRPKVCGEYLSPEAGRVLDRLGVLKTLDAAGAVALGGMRITAPDGTVLTGRYRAVGAHRPYREHAIGVSRAVLDGVLLERLRALPVDVREGLRVTDVIVEDGGVVGVRAVEATGAAHVLRAPVVVAADGRASIVAQRLGCRRPHRLARMALVTYVSGVDGCRDFGEVYVDPPDYAILNPLAADRVNLSLVVPLAHAAPWSSRLEDFFVARVRQLPHLARRLEGARREAPLQAMGPLAYRVTPPHVGGVLLVGDAAGFYDPFTGEGIFAALRGAELAADTVVRALRAGDVSAAALGAYERARRAAFADKDRLTRGLQLLIRHRRLANLAARWLGKRPAALDALLGVIGDFVPPRALPRLLRGA
jgi:flavin-dependent dehydrogenase